MAENKTTETKAELLEQLEALKAENKALTAELQAFRVVAAAAVIEAPNGLNIRTGPSKAFDVIVTLPTGTTVNVLELPNKAEVPGWVLVTLGDYTGWCMEEFLKDAE